MKRKGSSKAGRPKKAGARYPSGKLKPAGPNEAVVARRRLICADVTKATCPLDAAHANGWISEDDHRAGVAYATLHRRAGLGAPGIASGGNAEAELGSEVLGKTFAHMTDVEVAAIWDSAFRHVPNTGETVDPMQREVEATRLWRLVNDAMSPAVRAEMHRVCIQEAWPEWIRQRTQARQVVEAANASNRAMTRGEINRMKAKTMLHEANRELLVEGCRLVRELGWRKTEGQSPRIPTAPLAPAPKAVGRKVEESTTYVDEQGTVLLRVVRRVRVNAA